MHRTRLLELLQFDKMSECELEVEMSDAKTCKWLISHPEYQKWLDLAKATVHNGLLWISGKPGAGKSTVMRFAYSAMKNKAHHQQTVVASFFFNNRAGSLQRSPAGMYRALLLQLFEGYPDLLTVLDDMELNPRSRNIRLPLNVLEELFEKAVSTLGRRLFICYVDGLSECDEDQAVEIAYFFEGLAERSAAKHIQFRVCFSARHHPCIPTRTGIRITLENQPGHNEALKDHVTCNLRLSDPALAESIRLEILRKASGMFLWAALVVDSLNKEDRQGGLALIKKLRETPIGLTDLYKDILKRDKDNMEAFQLCMRWILYPKRPLHPKEFYHGLWAGLSPKNLVDPQIPDVSSPATSETLDKFERFVVSSSKGLAEINRSQRPTVRFVHDSVRDFLIQDDGLGEVWPALDIHHEHLGHNTLKQCCNFYLNHQEVHASAKKLASTSHSREKAEILKLYPFLEYVSQYPT